MGTESDDTTVAEPIDTEGRRIATAPAATRERYEQERLLGMGGMGEVVSVHDRVLGREVAIKRMKAETPTAIQISRFLREAQIQARLDHPAIPPVHELARDERGLPYFVMKRLNGTTLLRILEGLSTGDRELAARFPRKRLLRAFVDVCLAIELAHTKGIIHRDIKPANIMLGEFGEVFVLDWGIAKVDGDFDPWAPASHESPPDSEETVPGTILGTRGYMAPEQRHGDEVGVTADIYALGCVLFEILTVQRVPRGAALTGSLHPAAHDPDVSPELDSLCAAATAPIPDARLASARELGERTQRYLDGDRDLELRRQLAQEHYQRAAAATGDDDSRLVALREATRALALDPTHADAARLVGRLMLEPPEKLPAALDRELEATSRAAIRRQARLAIAGYGVVALFIPHMLWSGLREPRYLVAFIGFLAALVGYTFLGTGVIRYPRLAVTMVLVFATAFIAMMARMYSPFLVAPGIAAVVGVMIMSTPLFRTRRLLAATIAALVLGVLGPYALEVLGVLHPTVSVIDGHIAMGHLAIEVKALQTGLGLSGFVVGLVSTATVVTFIIATRDGAARRQLQIQAWQLRQLVPEPQDRATSA